MDKTSIGDRMKTNYENISRYFLTRRTPVILRLDGKSFHSLTKKYCQKPFDEEFTYSMASSANYLYKNIQGIKFGYVQSDEVSFLITDFDKLETQAPFNYNLQKLSSISASLMSVSFNKIFMKNKIGNGDSPIFDARLFNIPKEEVVNYFIWRQADSIRNSIQLLGQANFTHNDLDNKSCNNIIEMLENKGIIWNNIKKKFKYGQNIDNIGIHDSLVFKDNREIIEKYIYFS